jgi:GH25 family lysozyme M1 (1,4-beta-N-acetylmuramidase)
MEPPPDGVETTDCSLYVLTCYEAAGVPFSGVRTAEQIRQACLPIGWDEILKGDLLFFENTYNVSEPPAADGHVASHIAISLGAGTHTVWQAVEPAVEMTNINTPYWQDHIFEARRSPRLQGTPPATGTTVPGIDVASYQTADLSHYIQISDARHVVVRAYMEMESPSADHSVAQAQSARANGCSVGVYGWLYAGMSPWEQVRQMVATMERMGPCVGPLWLDIERYTDGSLPSVEEIGAALEACGEFGVVGGIYTGAYIWQELGNPQFPDVPLWFASYDSEPSFSQSESFGAMAVWGKQYSSTAPDGSPLDMDSFAPEAVA